MIRKLIAVALAPIAFCAMAMGTSPAQARPASDVLTEYYYDAEFQEYAGFTWLTCNGGFIVRGVTNTAYRVRDQESCSEGGSSQRICQDCSLGECSVVACPPNIFQCSDSDPNCPKL